INDLQLSKKALEAEYEAQRAIVREFKERGKVLTKATKELAVQSQYKAPKVEPIYEPEVSTDLLGKHVKIRKEEYEKMLASQKESMQKHKDLAKNFDMIAERLKKANVNNYYLSVELEKAKKAIPVKDRVIEQQQEQIKELTQRIKQFKSMCVDFIKENVPKAFDLMNSLAQKFNLVKDVNESMKQDKEREQREKKMQRRSRDDWEMER
ncbi:hypothetical protein AB4Y85_19405, partial [Microvirga sp. 2YAF29]|uniref:hypothetical protein n=1 Tax=Microvirga sp. 2YAF29 TaxID=3233031 RepID=UPI003F9D8006